MSKFVFLILAATIFALIDFENQNTETNCSVTKRINENVDKIDFFRWLEKRTHGHRNFESNLIRNKMIAAVNPSKKSFVEHFASKKSFQVLEKKGVVLSHGYHFDRVVGIYLLEKIIYKEKYKFIAAPEVVIFPFNYWEKTDKNGWFVAFGPAFAMEYIRGVSPALAMYPKYVPKKTLSYYGIINKEQLAEMHDLLKRHYVDYVHTKNGPNFLFDQNKIVCIDTERHNFPNIDKLGFLHHEKCQRTLLKTDSIKRRDDDRKKTVKSPKIDIGLPNIEIPQRLKIPDSLSQIPGFNIKSIGNVNM